MIRLLLLSLLFLNFTSFSQKRDPFLEEQGVYVQSRWTLSDTVRVIKIINKAKKIAYLESNRSEKLYRTALHISKQIETDEWTVRALLGISTAKIYQNERDSALYYADKAKPIAKRTGMPELTIGCIDQEAVIYSYLEQYDKATDLSFEAIKAAEKISPKYAKRSYGTLGYAFMKLGDLKKSSTYSTKAYELAKKYNDTSLMLSALNVIALNYKNTDKLDEAIASFEEGLELSRASNNIQRESQILYNLANIFFIQGEDLKGLQYFEESVEMSKPNATFEENAYSFHALAYANSQIGNFKTAHKFADSALSYALLSKSYELITEAYAINAQVYWELGDSENAFACLTRAYAYKDSMNIAQLRDAAILSESDFEKEKKRLEDSLKTEQQRLELANEKRMSAQKLKSRDQLIWIFAIALILLLIAGYFILKNNRLIKIQNALVNRQKEEIQEQHNEIRDSIDYAKRIQQAMINKQSEWDAIGQHYILFKPKDVVSGDFYWAFHKKNLAIWVVADCTGHGVPGAFMSMLGFGFLNEIVVERDCSDAAEILNLLRAKIVSALRGKGENQARDGMDISVCIWDKTKQTLQYAGANNPLWLIRHRSTELPEHTKRTTQIEDSALQLLEIEPDKMPVGFVDVNAKPFANKSIQLFEGDVIVQLTDGFADQFGGPHGKKLKYAAMKRALLEFQSKSFEQQEKALDTLFESWKGDLEQVDDVCVVAVKVS